MQVYWWKAVSTKLDRAGVKSKIPGGMFRGDNPFDEDTRRTPYAELNDISDMATTATNKSRTAEAKFEIIIIHEQESTAEAIAHDVADALESGSISMDDGFAMDCRSIGVIRKKEGKVWKIGHILRLSYGRLKP